MKFVMHRDKTISSTCGLSMEFKKGVPVFVPPPLYAEVIAVGGVPEEPLPDDPAPVASAAPQNSTERDKRLADAFDVIVKRNRREDFTAAGMPHAAVLSTEAGWTLSAKERDLAWVKYTAGKE